MRGTILVVLLAAACAGCGRVGFDASIDARDGASSAPYQITVTIDGVVGGRVVSTPPAIDCPGTCTAEFTGAVTLTASSDDATRFVVWSGACTDGNIDCDLVPTGTDRAVTATFALQANRVFITASTHNGNLGGLPGADALCQQEATTAGLVGTFIAFLSTPTVDAIDRFAGTNSRGWVRPDGAPVADTIDSLIAGAEFSPIVVDARGMTVPIGQSVYIFTGSGGDGRQDINGTCQVWNSASSGDDGGTADSGSAPMVGIGGGALPCSEAQHLFCFEIGRNVPVAPPPILVPGRTVFLTHAAGSSAFTGVGALDMLCQNEATSATLGGTYVAAVATTTASIAAHVGSDARAFYRPDQSLVADSGATFFAGQLRGFVNQYADGTYQVFYGAFVTGQMDATSVGDMASTCNDWTSTAGAGPLPLGIWGDTDGPVFWGAELSSDCTAGDPLLCIEQ